MTVQDATRFVLLRICDLKIETWNYCTWLGVILIGAVNRNAGMWCGALQGQVHISRGRPHHRINLPPLPSLTTIDRQVS